MAARILQSPVAMAAVDSFYLLYREIARSCSCYVEALALVGAWYTARKSIPVICDFYSLVRLHFIPRLGSRPDLIKQYGRWAVISGATDGIGKAYAEELASHGLNIILISQEEEKLQAVAKHIADTYRVETLVLVADFSRGREIYAPIREALRDRDIGILVNDVGAFYPYPQYFSQVPEDTIWDIVNVNIAAASLMVHIVLPGMVERKKGAIVTVSSGSCCKPTPQLAAFSASKAYLDHFSRALQYEYASKGIFVQSLIPFYVTSSVTAPGSFLRRCPWLAPSPRVYAQHAVSTLGISKRTTGYWSHSIQIGSERWLGLLLDLGLWYKWSLGLSGLGPNERSPCPRWRRSGERNESLFLGQAVGDHGTEVFFTLDKSVGWLISKVAAFSENRNPLLIKEEPSAI